MAAWTTLYRCVCCAVVDCVVMDVCIVWRHGQRCPCQSLVRNYCPLDVKSVKNYNNRIVTSMKCIFLSIWCAVVVEYIVMDVSGMGIVYAFHRKHCSTSNCLL